MMLLAESALRSSLLIAAVWLALKLLRVRNPYTEMAAWSGVLIASLAMPILMRWAPAQTIALPSGFYRGLTGIAPAAGTAEPTAATGFPLSYDFLAAYLALLLLLLARLAHGLIQGLRLVRRAQRAEGPWTQGRDIRFSADLALPAAIGRTILLPVDFAQWEIGRQRAVLAHEASHVARGDFYLLLLAALHRALFWFSPLSWWLHRRLADLAEASSDAAALIVAENRPAYAQILIDLAGTTRSVPAGLAMANHPTVRRRIERILSENGLPAGLSFRKLALVALCLVPASLAAGGITGASEAGRAQPGSEAMLRSHIEQVQRGEIDDSTLGVEGMAAGMRSLLPRLQPEMTALGPILSAQFHGVDQEGNSLYLVTHAHGARQWGIRLDKTGRIQSIWFASES